MGGKFAPLIQDLRVPTSEGAKVTLNSVWREMD